MSLKSLSEQHAATNSAVDVLQFLLRQVRVLGVDVDDHVADFLVGLQELTGDVDAVLCILLLSKIWVTDHQFLQNAPRISA